MSSVKKPAERRRSEAPERSSVQESTRVTLDGLGFTDSPLGSMALALAERVDVGNETGAATAALAREWRATMEAIEAKVPSPAGKVSDLRLRLLDRANGSA